MSRQVFVIPVLIGGPLHGDPVPPSDPLEVHYAPVRTRDYLDPPPSPEDDLAAVGRYRKSLYVYGDGDTAFRCYAWEGLDNDPDKIAPLVTRWALEKACSSTS